MHQVRSWAAEPWLLILGRDLGGPAAHLPPGPQPAESGLHLGPRELAESWMDFHCLITVQLGPGVVPQLPARYLSLAAQLDVQRPLGQGKAHALPGRPHPGACASAFGRPQAPLQELRSPGTKRCLWEHLRIQTRANGSQTEPLKTCFRRPSRLLSCS